MKHPIFALFAFVFALIGCAADPPKTGPGTPFPCGPRGRSCGNHRCCDQDEICGAPSSNCDDGMCCWNGQAGGEAQPLWRAKPRHPQTDEQR